MVVDDDGQPVAGARLWLLPVGLDAASEVADLQGSASGTGPRFEQADARGSFAIVCRATRGGEHYELHVQAPNMCETVSSFGVTADSWRDLGYVRMKEGMVLEGSVVRNTAAREPLSGAMVSILPYAHESQRSVIPGQEHGLATTTDASGFFRFTTTPFTTVSVAAVAPGYAKAERTPIHVGRIINRVDFTLDPGTNACGKVVDVRGRPISAAWVTAVVVGDVDGTKVRAFTGSNGVFELLGVRPCRYDLRVTRAGFEPTSIQTPLPSDVPLNIIAHTLPSLRVKTLGIHGQALDKYRVSLRIVKPGRDSYASGPISKMNVHADAGGWSTLHDVPVALELYVLQVEAEGLAHAFSEPFTLSFDEEPRNVVVQLSEGGQITGFICDSLGKPLKGALVITLPANIPESRMLLNDAEKIDTNITRTGASTGEDGSFTLNLLHPGRYFLRAYHSEHCNTSIQDVVVRPGQPVQLPTIQMRSGATLSGNVKVDGELAGWVKITVSPANEAANATLKCFETFARKDGHFALKERLPPGTYRVLAGRPSTPDPHSPPLRGAATKEFTIGNADTQASITLELTTN